MSPILDTQLLQRYDVPAPRYTSYPTALTFRPMEEPPSPRPLDAARPLSLYFHLAFCRSLCWYCACHKVITRRQSRTGAYLSRLLSEVDQRIPWLEGRPVVQIHLGGGTPTFFEPEELEILARYIRGRLDVMQDAELSIEIDPRELSAEHVKSLRSAGYTRASLGVQDHDDAVQQAIHRVQPYELTRSVTEQLRDAGFESINFDLVYGLPLQTEASFRRTIEDVIALDPDRLAVYSYAHVPSVAPAQKLLEDRYHIPGADEKIAMFLAAAEMLIDAGYEHIGMDHFAKPTDSLAEARRDGTLRRNFMGYTTHRGVDIHAFGMSAISQTDDAFFQNERDIAAWEAAIDEGRSPVTRGYVLDDDDRLRRDVIMAIMCSNRVDFAALGTEHDVDFREYFADELGEMTELSKDGLVNVTARTLEVTPLGRFFVRNIATAFDAYRGKATGYSRAI